MDTLLDCLVGVLKPLSAIVIPVIKPIISDVIVYLGFK
jgi:hypothetical protein